MPNTSQEPPVLWCAACAAEFKSGYWDVWGALHDHGFWLAMRGDEFRRVGPAE